jgi:uroporphyrinogen decarboxylase
LIHNPVRGLDDVQSLHPAVPQESLAFTLEAIRLARVELQNKVPLIGFSGAPFTLASYAIEGGGSRHMRLTKEFMYGQSRAWHRLMDILSVTVAEYLKAQAQAGAQALQLFDSWVGILGPLDYHRFVLPYNQRVLQAAQSTGVPVIHFSTGTAGMLGAVTEAGGDVISIDWRIELDRAWSQIGFNTPIQGNLDPIVLMAPRTELEKQVDHILQQAEGRVGHIFNLGHGILPQTPVDHVAALVDMVHEKSSRQA